MLRGGLTPKHVDVPELLKVLDFRPQPVPYLEPERPQPGVEVFRPDVPDFELTVVSPEAAAAGVTLPLTGPAIAFCTSGEVRAAGSRGDGIDLPRGHAAYLEHEDVLSSLGLRDDVPGVCSRLTGAHSVGIQPCLDAGSRMSLTEHESARIVGRENIVFGDPVLIDDFVLVMAREPIIIGNFVHLACFSSITGGARVDIGDFSAVSQGARLLTGTDDFTGWGFGNSTVDERYRNTTRAPISVGRFCVIGANAVVLPGVTIGEGATIGAGTVVTRGMSSIRLAGVPPVPSGAAQQKISGRLASDDVT